MTIELRIALFIFAQMKYRMGIKVLKKLFLTDVKGNRVCSPHFCLIGKGGQECSKLQFLLTLPLAS